MSKVMCEMCPTPCRYGTSVREAKSLLKSHQNKPIVWFDWSSFLCLFWYWVVPESLETSKQRSIFFYTVPLLHCNCVD